MKFLHTEAKKQCSLEPRLCHYYASSDGYQPLEEPAMSNQISCRFCGCEWGGTLMLEDKKRAWFCGRICEASKLVKSKSNAMVAPTSQRSLEWPLFCEINGIGDKYHDVCFENIRQSDEQIKYLREYAKKPNDLILMSGPSGLGKTYACLALCELYTRHSTSCMFFTQASLFEKWKQTANRDDISNFVSKSKETSLLIIDDFGTSELSPTFLAFCLDLVNSRMQWTNRGTVITTNLDSKKFNSMVGEAMSDRLNTGQILLFSGQSRRKKPIV